MKYLISLLVLLVSLPTWARQFDIEVIIFKRAVSPERVSESWPSSLPPINFEKAGSPFSAAFMRSKGAKRLRQSEYHLNPQENILNNHAGYQVLFHTVWRQGDKGPLRAPVMHIQAGRDYSDTYDVNGKQLGPKESIPMSGVVEEQVPQPVYELDGKLQVYVQHYLYANAQFDLREPVTEEVSSEDAPILNHDQPDADIQLGNLQSLGTTSVKTTYLKSYRFDQKRKMRSGEIHYFDHPLMGMIIQVRKVAQ